MVSISFGRFVKMTTKRAVVSCGLVALFLVFGNANAQTYTFDPENFLPGSTPSQTECSGDGCGGQVFLRMGEPVIADGRASVGIWLRAELDSSLADVTPYSGVIFF